MAVVINVYGKASLAQIDRATAQLGAMRKEATAQAGPWKTMGSAIRSTWAKIGSTVAAVAVAKWLKDSLGAARAYQLGLAQLRTAVIDTTHGGAAAWAGYQAQMNKVVDAQSNLSAYSHGQLEEALTTLTQTTGSSTKGLKLLGLATDLARAKNMDLGTASKLVGKVADGNTSSLARYGIVLKKGSTSTEALAALQQRFAGAAKTYGDSSAGAADKFHNSLQQLQITVGTALLPVVNKLMGYLNTGLSLFQKLPGPVKDVVVALGAIAGVAAIMAPFVGSIVAAAKAMKIAQAATKLWSAAEWLLNAAMDANPIALVVIAVAALAAGFLIAYDKSARFRAIVQAVWQEVKTLAAVVLAAFHAVTDLAATFGGKIAAAVGDLGHLLVAAGKAVIDGYLAGMKAEWHVATDLAKTAGSAVKAAVGDLTKLLSAAGKAVIDGYVAGMKLEWHVATSLASTAGSAVKTAVGDLGRLLIGAGEDVVSGLKAGMAADWSLVTGLAGSFDSKIKAAVGDLSRLLYSVGQAIVSGLLSGIESAWSGLVNKLQSLIGGLSKAAKKLLGIGSPSRVFAEIGAQTAAGLALGMDGARSAVAAAAGRMAGAAIGGGTPALAGGGVGAGAANGALVVAPGAFVINLNASDAGGSPAAIGQAVAGAVAPSLEQLAREVRRVVRR
jgi:uncharacterized protein (DUF2062 family)